jgi:hypothetical protein
MQTDFLDADCSFLCCVPYYTLTTCLFSSSDYVLIINHNLTWLCFLYSKLQPRKLLHFSLRDESLKLVDGNMEIGDLLFVGRTCVLCGCYLCPGAHGACPAHQGQRHRHNRRKLALVSLQGIVKKVVGPGGRQASTCWWVLLWLLRHPTGTLL